MAFPHNEWIRLRARDSADYDFAIKVLQSEDMENFQELEQLLDGFPEGVDGFIGRRWITNAIDIGSKASIAWILERDVDLSFCDDEGYTVLHSALQRNRPDRHEVLELILQHGAPVNAHGINDWTAAHMAGASADIEALKILIRFEADLSIRTRIDSYATPLEEARTLGQTSVVDFLKRLKYESNKMTRPAITPMRVRR